MYCTVSPLPGCVDDGSSVVCDADSLAVVVAVVVSGPSVQTTKYQSINKSVYYAQGSTIEYRKQNEHKMKKTRENKTQLKHVGKIIK